MKKTFCIIVFLLTTTFLFGQKTKKDTASFIDRHKYLKFLLKPADDSQASLLTGGWQYLYSPWGKTFKTGGMCLSVGLNVARFFSNKFILGLYVDIKGIKGFTRQRFSDNFTKDFNNSFITSYSTQADSALAYTVRDAINNQSFRGNYVGNIGVMFSPFPQKYGGIMLVFKKGYRSYPIDTYGNKYIEDGKSDITLFDLNKNYSFALTIKPAAFFQKGTAKFSNMENKQLWSFITIGFYYEQLYLKNAIFYGMDFNKMVNSNFINKYGVDKRYGITLGIALY